MMRWVLGSLSLAALLLPLGAAAQYNNTPDNWRCERPVSGEWRFGRAPVGCDVAAFGDPVVVYQNFAEQVFDDAASRDPERRRYMQALHAFVREAADYYLLQRRGGSVSMAERNAWRRAVMAMAHQESFLSHYRQTTNGQLKMMRGDRGHGHGLLQIDDRWHFVSINQGNGWSLVGNLVYGMDEFYAAWQRAPAQWCVNSASDWTARSRAAWAAFNGGPTQLCRWTNSAHPEAFKDRGYRDKLAAQGWLSWIADPNAPVSVDVGCLIEGNSQCAGPGDDWRRDLLLLEDGRACSFDGARLHCLEAQRNAACLRAVSPEFVGDASQQLSTAQYADLPISNHNRHGICPQVARGLVGFGEFIRLNRNIALRSSPGGPELTVAPADALLQITDFEVRSADSGERYYRVWANGHSGYIYAGDNDDHGQWLRRSLERTSGYAIANSGDRLRVEVSNGLALRATPGGEQLTTLPAGSEFVIKDHVAFGDNNRTFYHLEHEGGEGFVFGGSFAAWPSYGSWASLIERQAETVIPCPEGTAFDRHLLACRDEVDAWALFTPAQIERCVQAGGGAPCHDRRRIEVAGQELEMLRWSVAFARSLRGSGDCPHGSQRRWDHGYHCAVVDNGEVTDVLGPFGIALADECLAKGGGGACYSPRWSAGFWRWVSAMGQ